MTCSAMVSKKPAQCYSCSNISYPKAIIVIITDTSDETYYYFLVTLINQLC